MPATFTLPSRLDRFAAVQSDARRELQATAAATKAARHAAARAKAQELDAARLARMSRRLDALATGQLILAFITGANAVLSFGGLI